MAESNLKPPQPIMTGGRCAGQFVLHDVGAVSEPFTKSELCLFEFLRVGASSMLDARIKQIRTTRKLRVIIDLNTWPTYSTRRRTLYHLTRPKGM